MVATKLKEADILALLRAAPLLRGAEWPALAAMAASARQTIIMPGQLLITEGEVSTKAWILLSGALLVFTRRHGDEIALARITEAGSFVGEQALSPDRPPRNASVRALCRTVLIELNRDAVETLFTKRADFDEQLRALARDQADARLAAESSVIAALARQGKTALNLDIRSFADGEAVFRQGDRGDDLYVVRSGIAAVRTEDSENNALTVARLLPGQSFGERALLSQGRRTASVYAEGQLDVMVIGRDDFLKLYHEDSHLKSYFRDLERVYSLSSIGLVTQYSGRFLDREAINFLIRRHDGAAVIASRLPDQPVFSVRAETHDESRAQTITWQSGDGAATRRLEITDGRLTAAFVTGAWDQIDTLYRLVIEQAPWRDRDNAFFLNTGQFPKAVLGHAGTFICKCMQVDEASITALVSEGADSLAGIQDRCGAGAMCGGCIPKIEQLIGVQGNFIQAELADIIPHSDDIRALRFIPAEGCQAGTARIGQHIIVRGVMDGVAVERSYTLTSSVAETQWQEITVRRDRNGTFSRYLFELKAGARLEISQPRGQNCPDRDAACPLVCLCAGIGITPAVNICRSFADLQAGRPVHLLHVARNRTDLAVSAELKSLAAHSDWLTMTEHVTAEQGPVTPDIIGRFAQIPDARFIVCGPAGFQQMVAGALGKTGVPPHRVTVESFGKIGAHTAPEFHLSTCLAAGFALAYLVHGLAGAPYDPLAFLHETRAGANASGLALLAFLGLQGRLSFLRWKQRWAEAGRNLTMHRWFGLGVMALLAGHGTALGHGHVFLLVLALLLVVLSSLFVSSGPFAGRADGRRAVMTAAHIALSVAMVGLVLTHIIAVMYY